MTTSELEVQKKFQEMVDSGYEILYIEMYRDTSTEKVIPKLLCIWKDKI